MHHITKDMQKNGSISKQFHGKGIELKTLIDIIHERLFSGKYNVEIQSFSCIILKVIN